MAGGQNRERDRFRLHLICPTGLAFFSRKRNSQRIRQNVPVLGSIAVDRF
jgi:hypothetical protein